MCASALAGLRATAHGILQLARHTLRNDRDRCNEDRQAMIAFVVTDMTDTRSATAVTKAVKAVDQAALVCVDLATSTVEIDHGTATAKELSDAINRAGYSPVAA